QSLKFELRLDAAGTSTSGDQQQSASYEEEREEAIHASGNAMPMPGRNCENRQKIEGQATAVSANLPGGSLWEIGWGTGMGFAPGRAGGEPRLAAAIAFSASQAYRPGHSSQPVPTRH